MTKVNAGEALRQIIENARWFNLADRFYWAAARRFHSSEVIALIASA